MQCKHFPPNRCFLALKCLYTLHCFLKHTHPRIGPATLGGGVEIFFEVSQTPLLMRTGKNLLRKHLPHMHKHLYYPKNTFLIRKKTFQCKNDLGEKFWENFEATPGGGGGGFASKNSVTTSVFPFNRRWLGVSHRKVVFCFRCKFLLHFKVFWLLKKFALAEKGIQYWSKKSSHI